MTKVKEKRRNWFHEHSMSPLWSCWCSSRSRCILTRSWYIHWKEMLERDIECDYCESRSWCTLTRSQWSATESINFQLLNFFCTTTFVYSLSLIFSLFLQYFMLLCFTLSQSYGTKKKQNFSSFHIICTLYSRWFCLPKRPFLFIRKCWKISQG